MADELTSLMDIAMDREIVSQAFYIAGEKKTQDPGAKQLMKELAGEELKHLEIIKNLKENGLDTGHWHLEKVPDLMISEYLVDVKISDDAGIQDVLTAAVKREQQSVEFYSKMTGITEDVKTKRLCEKLAHEELKHKMKLEILYDDLFYKED